MISPGTSVAFAIALAMLSSFANANTEEVVKVKFINRDFKASSSEIKKILKKADLEKHGYKKEVSTKLNWSGSKIAYRQTSYFYYKIVNCSRIQEVEQELDTLIPGVFGKELATQLSKEVKTKRLEKTGECKVGMEILSKGAESHYDNVKAPLRRQKRRKWKLKITINLLIFKVEFTIKGGKDE